jgi:SAM-dependent methyltransferase
MNCRFCNHKLSNLFVDLNSSPPSNAFLTKEQLNEGEVYYPLILYVCDQCYLVQIDEYKKADEIFNQEYVYFSSYSSTWLKHCEQYSELVTNRFGLNEKSLVMEIASNDGYLLQYFKNKNIPVLGIEPTRGTAYVAIAKGINTVVEFFGESFAKKLITNNPKADLLIGNNVLAHVPDINDFVKGLKVALKDDGVITMEFPHLFKLIEDCQFDTIYHEHFSYLSFITVEKIFAAHGLTLFDVEEIPTHGGSLRIYGQHKEYDKTRPVGPAIELLRAKEKVGHLTEMDYYKEFQIRVNKVKYELLEFLINHKKQGAKIAAYGAAAKGNTILNYCGVKNDLVDFVVDISPYKQGKYLPGNHIPVVKEDELRKQKPEYILILPWNIQNEIMEQLAYVKEWVAKFVIAIPALKIIHA